MVGLLGIAALLQHPAHRAVVDARLGLDAPDVGQLGEQPSGQPAHRPGGDATPPVTGVHAQVEQRVAAPDVLQTYQPCTLGQVGATGRVPLVHDPERAGGRTVVTPGGDAGLDVGGRQRRPHVEAPGLPRQEVGQGSGLLRQPQGLEAQSLRAHLGTQQHADATVERLPQVAARTADLDEPETSVECEGGPVAGVGEHPDLVGALPCPRQPSTGQRFTDPPPPPGGGDHDPRQVQPRRRRVLVAAGPAPGGSAVADDLAVVLGEERAPVGPGGGPPHPLSPRAQVTAVVTVGQRGQGGVVLGTGAADCDLCHRWTPVRDLHDTIVDLGSGDDDRLLSFAGRIATFMM